MNGIALKELARALAVVAHDGQLRKGTGEPYMMHIDRVADSVMGWQAKTVAYLHDLIEDTEITLALLVVLGFPDEIVVDVDTLTRREKDNEPYIDFIERCTQGSEIAKQVKLADVQDNLRDLDDLPGDRQSLKRRYVAAQARILESLGSDGLE